MDKDIDGNCWYVHVDGVHEGAFSELVDAVYFMQCYITQGRYNIMLQSRDDWIRETGEVA